MSRIRVATLATAALTLALRRERRRSETSPRPTRPSSSRAVTVDGIVEHQRALQNIADMNGGTRYTKTPGYTASVAYVRETMESAGLERLDHRSSTCRTGRRRRRRCFQQLSPTAKTYVAGTAADDNSPAVDYIAFEFSPTKEVASAPVVPTNDIVRSRARRRTRQSGCEAEDFPAATDGRDLADPARHLRVHAEARERRRRRARSA